MLTSTSVFFYSQLLHPFIQFHSLVISTFNRMSETIWNHFLYSHHYLYGDIEKSTHC